MQVCQLFLRDNVQSRRHIRKGTKALNVSERTGCLGVSEPTGGTSKIQEKQLEEHMVFLT